MTQTTKKDLIVVVADLDAENAVKTILASRQKSLKIKLNFNPERYPTGDILRFDGRDPGCYRKAPEIFKPLRADYAHALIIFDRHGCGAEHHSSRDEIELDVERRIHQTGWAKDAASAVVFDPELEVWVWASSIHVADILGWKDDREGLRPYLQSRDLWKPDSDKPIDPKEAMQQALRKKQKPYAAPLFEELASKVAFRNCNDPAFQKFRELLTRWFG